MAAPKPKLIKAEIDKLVSAAEAMFGFDVLVGALIGAIGPIRARRLATTRAAIPWAKADTMACVDALWPLVPGSTAVAKRKAITKAVRPCFAIQARYDAVMGYVLERVMEYLAAPAAPAVAATAYPVVGKGTITGYGPVNNHWKIPDAVVVQILDRMQARNVRAYKVESVGHASEDVLGKSNLLAEMKRKTLLAASECARRGIYYHVTLFNDNAGKNTWRNAGPSLGDRLRQAKAFIDWFAATVPPNGVYVVIVGETRTSAGKELEKYGAKALKAAGFRIGNNEGGGRPRARTTFGGIGTDFFEYHPVNTSDWPADKKAHVTGDTGAILAQLNQRGNVYGLGNPAAVAAWRANGEAAGYDFVIYYGFDVAEFDGPTIDAMSPNQASGSAQPTAAAEWPSELANVQWLHANVRDWPTTAQMTASISGGQIRFPYDKANSWPVATSGVEKGTNANVWAIPQINGRWYAATWEWLRQGQTSKPMWVLDKSTGKGDHFKVAPLNNWRPRSGERFYIMVSGHARASGRNVQERSNPAEVIWP